MSEDSSAERALVDTVVARAEHAIKRLANKASWHALETSARASTDVGTLAALLSELAATEPAVLELDPTAMALINGAALKQELIRQAGGALTTGQVARLLRIKRQAVDQRVRRGQLLAVPAGKDGRLFPAVQFTEDGVIEGFERVLAAFAVKNPWMQLSALLDTDPAAGGNRTLVDALQSGDVDAVVQAAAAFGEQGAR